MKIECRNAACKHQFEVPDTANTAAVRCPICGTPIKAAPPPLPPAVSAPAVVKPARVAAARPPSAPSRPDLPPYLAIPTITDPNLTEIPPLEQFQALHSGEELVKNYQIRIRRPKPPWLAVLLAAIPAILFLSLSFVADRDASIVLVTIGMIFLVIVALVIGGFFLFRVRGHTFLYLTNQRLIVLGLSEGTFTREQSVCHFTLSDICGFQVYAQRGLKKLFGLLLLREKRTFYLGIATRSCMNVEIGAVNFRRSEYEPGRDAVALCGELDAKVLALNAALAH
jgi:hypothetical protein